MGVWRQTYYLLKDGVDRYGIDALPLRERRIPTSPMKSARIQGSGSLSSGWRIRASLRGASRPS